MVSLIIIKTGMFALLSFVVETSSHTPRFHPVKGVISVDYSGRQSAIYRPISLGSQSV